MHKFAFGIPIDLNHARPLLCNVPVARGMAEAVRAVLLVDEVGVAVPREVHARRQYNLERT